MKVSSLHFCLTFYLPEKFLPLSSFSFLSLLPSHKHTPLDVSPSPLLLSICQAKQSPRQRRRRLTQWSESNGKRRRVAEEERSDGCQGGSTGDVGDRGVGWWREAWGAWCGFFLTGWSLLWADPLPAGSHVSWMCAGWGRMEKRRYKKEQWTVIMEMPC